MTRCTNKLFKLLVLPVMMYGHENWGPSLLTLASAMDSPREKVFRRFLRHVSGLRAGTPTAVLLTEAGQYPLDILTSLARTWNRYVDMSDSAHGWPRTPSTATWGSWVQPVPQTREVHPGPLRWSHVCPWHRLWLLMALSSILTCMSCATICSVTSSSPCMTATRA